MNYMFKIFFVKIVPVITESFSGLVKQYIEAYFSGDFILNLNTILYFTLLCRGFDNFV